jgi:hypothetical protein
VCHLAEAAHGIQGVEAKSVRFRRILLVATRTGEGPLAYCETSRPVLRRTCGLVRSRTAEQATHLDLCCLHLRPDAAGDEQVLSRHEPIAEPHDGIG